MSWPRSLVLAASVIIAEGTSKLVKVKAKVMTLSRYGGFERGLGAEAVT